MEPRKETKKCVRVVPWIGAACLTLAALFVFSALWALRVWPNLTVDEIVYHMTTTLEGVNAGIIWSFVWQSAVPALTVFGLSAFLLRKIKKQTPVLCACIAVFFASAAGSFMYMDAHLGLISWLRLQNVESDFIADNYADPARVNMTFPQKKRNLVYIFLESVETTYADTANGGAMDSNYIPRLTQLAMENEDFSGESRLLNGAYVLNGSTWTMGAMFAHTAGLPLKISIGGNDMNTQDSFFPGISTLGDVLEDAGYQQVLMVGSDATFGGRKLYFTDHGNFSIYDHPYAQRNGDIPKNYYVFWGYEDEKLFSFAKDELLALAAQDQPFNLTLLTVDTHFEDGYVCPRCEDTYGGNQYANVITCSDCQVTEFIAWAKTQSFYENTTFVVVGDHLTMDADFCENVSTGYQRRVYTAFINAAATVETPELQREYSTFDFFPTTLAALGVQIEGNRLALGTNLFSAKPTLLEAYGRNTFAGELAKNSRFMQDKAQIYDIKITDFNKKNQQITLHLGEMDQFAGKMLKVLWETDDETFELYSNELSKSIQTMELTLQLPVVPEHNHQLIVRTGKGTSENTLYTTSGYPLSCITDLDEYLKALLPEKDRYCIFIAAKDEASSALRDSTKELLRELGLSCDLTGQFRTSYCAAILPDEVHEKMEHAFISLSGDLPDGKTYHIVSAGYDTGDVRQIFVDDTNYAVGYIGLNFVVYNLEEGRVEDSVSFDTYSTYNATR